MVTAASDKRMRRRGGRRQQSGSTPAAVGAALRGAREATAAGLEEIHDRTGVPWKQLEALEAGDLSLFPDLRSAVTAVRRYSDLMQLDVDGFVRVTEDHWGPGQTGGENGGGARTSGAYLTASVPTGHLSRYPGDGTHLRAFTQTDEVPGVRRSDPPVGNGHGANGQFSTTSSFPAAPATYLGVRPAPVLLQGAVWLTAILLAVALGALAVQHYQPKWLADIHVVHRPLAFPPTSSAITTPGTPGQPARSGPPSPVTLADTSPGSATVSVRGANYSVVVAAWAPCWTEVHTPQSFSPVFAATMQQGQVKVFDPADGQVSVSMSASLVTVQVRINGKTVPGWLFKPTTVPFVLNFDSTTTS